MSEQVQVWYDTQCPLCVREIALMRRLDRAGRIQFLDAQAATDCPLDPQELLARLHARDPDGNLVSGAAAFAVMWRQIPVLWPLGQAARIRPIHWLLERAYLKFLAVRPKLQRLLSTQP